MNRQKPKILFLYTEIAEYFLACCKALLSKGAEVHIVRYPVNKEAPFKFQFPGEINVYERNDYDDAALSLLVAKIAPSVIVCSGWIDKGYLKICKHYKTKSITVLTLDNHWRGDLKQRIAAFISPFYLHNRFSYCWVPGSMQYQYAQRLGFKKEKIKTGFYSCDYDLFHQQYIANKHQKSIKFPKRFIYVGRYYEFKGIKELWQSFIDLQKENPNEWELWCLGTGDIVPVQHSKIKHFGFVQPDQLSEYIKNCGVFVLPSHFEPWGVVVHEFAAAGFPIICSDAVGAGTTFVENDYNGYIYKASNAEQLKGALKKMMEQPETRLQEMSERSMEKAKQITLGKWSDTLMSLLEK